MIFKGVCRKDGAQLAKYLLSSKNEQVRVLDVRGTVLAENSPEGLKSALKDFDELGKMTRGDKTIFHLAVNPNDNDRLGKQDWQYAVHKAEEALGLAGQPRAIVSHLYNGKEHLHVVWSRVDVDEAKCIHLSHSNLKLCQAAREVELDLGLQKTPDRNRGMNKAKELDQALRTNSLLADLENLPSEHRGTNQARQLNQRLINIEKHIEERSGKSKTEVKELIASIWHASETAKEFREELESTGNKLAIGNRGVVVVDPNGEVYSLSRVLGMKQKEVQGVLAELQNLPTVEELKKPAMNIVPPKAHQLDKKNLAWMLYAPEHPGKQPEIPRYEI